MPTDVAIIGLDEFLDKTAEAARRKCACVSCCGHMPIGAPTIADQMPRWTPLSCLAPTILQWLLSHHQLGGDDA